jgi:hypothetical protein
MTIKFTLKNSGRDALANVVSGILGLEAVYNGISPISRAVGGYIVKCTSRQKTVKGVTAVNIRFNMNNAGRKAFANAIGEILGEDVVYNGVPTFAYAVGNYIVDRQSDLICPADTDRKEINRLIAALAERGYEAISLPRDIPEADSNRLTVDIPLEGFTEKAIENLREIVASKNNLIKKALGVDSLQIDVDGDKLRFPWFTLTGANGEADTYSRFVSALCEMAKKQKRIIAKERETTNNKFSMRVFLIRLGFVGPEYKAARKLLLQNLSGNSAWKGGSPTHLTET